MNRTHPPSGLDLIDLAAELRAFDLRVGIDEALALRKSRRTRNSRRSLKGSHTKHIKRMAALRAVEGEAR